MPLCETPTQNNLVGRSGSGSGCGCARGLVSVLSTLIVLFSRPFGLFPAMAFGISLPLPLSLSLFLSLFHFPCRELLNGKLSRLSLSEVLTLQCAIPTKKESRVESDPLLAKDKLIRRRDTMHDEKTIDSLVFSLANFPETTRIENGKWKMKNGKWKELCHFDKFLRSYRGPVLFVVRKHLDEP